MACGASAQHSAEPALASASATAAPGSPAAKPMPTRPKPPTPASVTVKEPGGDAEDKQGAALFRQLDEAWGLRNDKDDQLHVPLPDHQHWKRVRFWGVEHFVGFRYGGDHQDRKSTRLNSSHGYISYAVFCLKKKIHNKSV